MPTESELHSQLAEVVAKYGVPELGPGEFTVAMLAESEGLTYNQAATVVVHGLSDGGLVAVGRRRLNGRVAKAYRATVKSD